MTSLLSQYSIADRQANVATPPRGPILLAIDGSAQSEALAAITHLLVGRTNADVQVVSTADPIALVADRGSHCVTVTGFALQRRDAQLEIVRGQIERAVGREAGWPIMIAEGDPALAIVNLARQRAARLIVCGHGRHGVLSRLAGPETVLELVQSAQTPVLAVEAGLRSLPNRAVIAIDFSAHSINAAALALELLPENATVHLVHVKPSLAPDPTGRGRRTASLDLALRRALDDVRDQLAPPLSMTVECIVVKGHPAPALLALAEASGASLIVSGSHGESFLDRFVLGSVATQLLRGARCSVLCVPTSVYTAQLDDGTGVLTNSVPSLAWHDTLDGFATRNRARLVRIITTDPGGHPRTVASADALLRLVLDVGNRVIFVVATADAKTQRTESLTEVTAIDIDVDDQGADRALRIRHKAGTTALSFVAQE